MAKREIRDAIIDPIGQAKKAIGSKDRLSRWFWLIVAAYNLSQRDIEQSIKKATLDPSVCEQTPNRRTEYRNNRFAAWIRMPLSWIEFFRALHAIDIRRFEIRITTYRGDSMEKFTFEDSLDIHPVDDKPEITNDAIDEASRVQASRKRRRT